MNNMAIRATNLLKVQIIDLNLFYFLHFIFLLIFPKFILSFFSFSLFLDLGRRYDVMIHITVTIIQSCNIKKNIKTIY